VYKNGLYEGYEHIVSETSSKVAELQKNSKLCSCKSQDHTGAKWLGVIIIPVATLIIKAIIDCCK
jgi:hypothetical protein